MKYIILFILGFSTLHANPEMRKDFIQHGIDVCKFDFEGHSYLVFYATKNPSLNGWIHDPECEKCKMQVENFKEKL